ncbi:T9SS type A sorting domain-containing protein [Adhaeribacter radiodurans]|uniref:T9SS type A sorting domain-containing protein n=1 Tax=Adhaeribacter radiodurans TaxID=2745197 RepID=A0A7L7L3Z9_9BACT|nr:T9SS type A sorting domain-containing protein [Adhaeribacter radiodurans]QMU27538.1 T9SS type A sorting domain-containing protein [Adhaeribacter radiodurans]
MKTRLSFLFKIGYLFIQPSSNGRLTLLLGLWLFVSFSSLAQFKIWEKTLGGNHSDELHFVQKTSDGGYIVGGSSSSGISGTKSEANRGVCTPDNCTTDYWVVKIDGKGNKVWDKTLGGNDSDILASVLQTSDGGYILAGYSYSDKSGDKSEANKGFVYYPDYWIVKLNANGKIVWDKTYGGNYGDYLHSLQLTPDGGYIVGGESNSEKSGDKSQSNNGSYDYWVLKLNASGNKVWDQTFGGDDSDDLYSLITTPDGGYLLGGRSSSNKSGSKSDPRKSDCTDGFGTPCYDYWVVKISEKGAKQWDKTFGGYHDDVLNTLVVATDGGYLLGGRSESTKSLDKSEPTRDETDDDILGDYWLVKIATDGSKVWDKTFGGNEREELTSILPVKDGGYLLSGSSDSESGGDMTPRRGVGDTWIIKIDAKGKKLWDTSVTSGSYITPTSDGNILLGGISGSYPNDDYWLVKLQIPNKKVQTIAFYPPDRALTSSPITLSAKASSGLPVTFKLISGPATQKSNQLRFTGYGTVVVKAFQAGDAMYSPVEYTARFRVQRFPKQQDKTIGGSGEDMLADLVTTPDGGYLLGGSSSSGISGDKSSAGKGQSDFWLVKTDANKKKIWDKSFGGKGTEKLAVIVPAVGGGYLLGGSSASGKDGDKSEANKGKNDYWLVKVDASGNKLWDKTIGGNLDDNLSAIVATPDGGYLLGGSSQSDISGDKSEGNKGEPDEFTGTPSDFWIVKVDNKGNKVWDTTIGNAPDDVLSSIIPTPDGNYLLGGYSTSTDDDTDYWVIKINAKGEQIWNKTYNREYSDRLTALVTTPEGGYLLVGISGFETYGYWAIKTDSKGNVIWDKFFLGSSIACFACEVNYSFPVDILPTSNNHYLLAGYTWSNQGFDRTEENRGNQDYWLVEIDENGQKISDKSFGARNSDELAAIIATPSGGFLLGGHSNSNSGYEKSENSKGNYDFWLIETKISAFPSSSLAAWNLRYGGSSSDFLTTVLPTNDGGYLLGGYSSSPKSGDKSQNSYGKNDYWVVKTDAAGNKLWDKRYGGSADDYLKSMVPTTDGGFLLGGSSESGSNGNKMAISKGGRDIWLVKISSSGEKEWDQTYGGNGTDDLQKIVILSYLYTDSYVLAGYSDSPVSGDKTQGTQGGLDYWLIKIYSFNGDIAWNKRFGGAGDDYLGDILALAKGDLLIGGTSFSSASGDKSQGTQGSSDYWLLRIDKDGKKLWDKRYGGSDQDQLLALLNTSYNSFLLAGHSASNISGEKSQNSKGGKDYWLVQVNGSGEKQWDKTYGGSAEETLRSLILDKDGGYVLGGTSFSGKSGDKTQTSQGASDYWLVKTNSAGTKLWDKRYGGSQQEELRALWTTQEGGYLLGGRSNSGVSGDRTQPSQGENDIWLVKVAPVKTITPLIASQSSTFQPEEFRSAKLLPLTAYPNPFVQEVNVTFRVPQTQKVTVKVFDSQGQEVTTLFEEVAQANQNYTRQWQAQHSAAGIYILRLQTNNHQSHQKVVLSR